MIATGSGRRRPDLPRRPRPASAVLALAGAGLLAAGAVQLLTGQPPARLVEIAVWLAAVLVAHDAVIAPVALGVALAVRRVTAGRRRLRLAVGTGLFVAVALTAVALPPLLAPGAPANPTVRPRDYPTGLGVLLAVDVAAVTAWLAIGLRRRARSPEG